MEDFLMIRSGFVKGIVNKIANKAIAKQGINARVDVGSVSVKWDDKTQKATVHLDVSAEVSKDDLIDILTKAGVL